MKLTKKFNQLTAKEYRFCIDHHEDYTDFNTLGLYRSLSENDKLTLSEKIEVRDYAHQFFKKSFDFLQLKDPDTFFKVTTLGQELTTGDFWQFWREVQANQEKILKEKKLKDRNFGAYSKHSCGWDQCPLNGVMLKPGSYFLKHHLRFTTDKDREQAKAKSVRLKKEQRTQKTRLKKSHGDE